MIKIIFNLIHKFKILNNILENLSIKYNINIILHEYKDTLFILF